MSCQQQSQMAHNLPKTLMVEMTHNFRKMLPKTFAFAMQKTLRETSINYLHEENSIVITEVNLDAEWQNIFSSCKSTPIFLLSATSI
ncbi:MAG: hypothetical protein QNJ63_17670 [Calothrix sp. MO_192.B10]|nr:hypothetical protein [Calothrix sp. MO_192.B10]